MYIRPRCFSCKHFIERWYCKAFPKGIPDKFKGLEYFHTEPYKGDNGIQYEPKEKEKE